jgi:hypothetical protein
MPLCHPHPHHLSEQRWSTPACASKQYWPETRLSQRSLKQRRWDLASVSRTGLDVKSKLSPTHLPLYHDRMSPQTRYLLSTFASSVFKDHGTHRWRLSAFATSLSTCAPNTTCHRLRRQMGRPADRISRKEYLRKQLCL